MRFFSDGILLRRAHSGRHRGTISQVWPKGRRGAAKSWPQLYKTAMIEIERLRQFCEARARLTRGGSRNDAHARFLGSPLGQPRPPRLNAQALGDVPRGTHALRGHLRSTRTARGPSPAFGRAGARALSSAPHGNAPAAGRRTPRGLPLARLPGLQISYVGATSLQAASPAKETWQPSARAQRSGEGSR
jgi:hypothetical protein